MSDSHVFEVSGPKGGHTIAVVAERTGLSRDVLRVWERRYNAVQPARTAGRQRLYSDAELSRFLLLARANRGGRTIGSIARLSTDELRRLVASDVVVKPHEPDPSAPPPTQKNRAVEAAVTAAIGHVVALDSTALDRELRLAQARFGLPSLLTNVVPDLMQRVGDDWMAGHIGIAHEHLASAVVLGILLESIRSLPEGVGAPLVVVATPSGEHHVLGAALLAAAAAMDGWTIRFLGADVPAKDLSAAAAGARAVALSLVFSTDRDRAIGEVRAVRAALPAMVPLILGGAAAVQFETALAATGAIVCQHIDEARSVLQALL